MAPKRSPERDEAKKLWLNSGKTMLLKEIAEKLGVAETLVRKWKCNDKWDDQANGNVTDSIGNVTDQKGKSNGNVTNKRGAPKGNHNAVGHGAPKGNKNSVGKGAPKSNKNAVGNDGGAPPGNKNAVTTGEYESIFLDCLTDEEQQIYQGINTDTLAQLNGEIKLLSIREHRMMVRIQNLMNGLTEKERKVLHELVTTKTPVPIYDEKSASTKVVVLPKSELVISEITETEFRKLDDIIKLEEALTRAQDKKTRKLALKHSIEADRRNDEERLLKVEKLRVEIAKLKDDDGDDDDGGTNYIEALKGTVPEVWDDDT